MTSTELSVALGATNGVLMDDIPNGNQSESLPIKVEAMPVNLADELASSPRQLSGGRVARKICKICGDTALGINFGAISCESCKAFFRRNARKGESLVCQFEGNCAVTVKTRRFCPHCRLRKCIDMGMNKDLLCGKDVEVDKRKRSRGESRREKKRSKGDSPEAFTDHQLMVDQKPPLTLQQQLQASAPATLPTPAVIPQTLPSLLPPSFAAGPQNPQGGGGGLDMNTVAALLKSFASHDVMSGMPDALSLLLKPPEPSPPPPPPPFSSHLSASVAPPAPPPSAPTGVPPTTSAPSSGGSFSNNVLSSLVKGLTSENISALISTVLAGSDTSSPNGDPSLGLLGGSQEPTAAGILSRAFLDSGMPSGPSAPGPAGSDRRVLSDQDQQMLTELKQDYHESFQNQDEELSEEDASVDALVNKSELTVRKLIKFCKRLDDFCNMSQHEQICLLKGVVLQCLFLRSCQNYNQSRDTWTISGNREVPAIILKSATGNSEFYDHHVGLVKVMKDSMQDDWSTLAILLVICLFTADRPNLKNRQKVSDIQDKYILLLKHHLESLYSYDDAQGRFSKLLVHLNEIHAIMENHSKVLMHTNPSEIEPLMLEIFDLK